MRWFFKILVLLIAFNAYAFDEKLALKESQAAIGRQVGDYRFLNSDGKEVRLSDLRGKPLVVHFIYTGCFQVCPATTQVLATAVARSEEHTSELQSPCNLVCRLLLEKKKTIIRS